jgi:hypothetical protein
MKKTLYRLRQAFGRQATLIQITNISTDYGTGEQTQTSNSYNISKLIKLPRKTSNLGTLRAALGIFNRGGGTDHTVTEFIFDAANLPRGIVPDIKNNYILIDNKRFNIQTVEELEGGVGYLVTAEAIEGAEL